MTELINKLMITPSISGREDAIRELIQNEITPYADEVSTDNMGNLIAFKKGSSANAKKLMLAAHMDEIGFLVTFIDEKGFVRVSNIGGINWAAAAFTHVIFENGTRGVIVPDAKTGANEYRADKFCIDIGAVDRADCEKYVKIGDFAVVEASFKAMSGSRYAGRPFDDRIGCAVLIEAASRMKECVNDTYFTFTVQEEVGCRGARTAAYGIAPDYSIAYDVTGTGDQLESNPMAVKLGDGAAIKIKDSSVLCDLRIVELLKKLAADNEIKSQLEILEHGGTDTSQMQAAGAGSIAGCISIPSRYIHSGVEMIDLDDVNACVDLTLALLAKELSNERG